MLKTLRDALKIKDIRKKLLYTFMMLIAIHFGSELPIPGVNTSYFADFFVKQAGDTFGSFNIVTGGSFISMSIFALSITPYITSSIIMQLMTITIPKLGEIQKEGEDGRKKTAEYTRYVTVGLALTQSIAMTVGSDEQGLLKEFNAVSVVVAVSAVTAGSALLIWIGERITEDGVGNGISIVLLFNIISSIPGDGMTLYSRFLSRKSTGPAVVTTVIIIVVIAAMVVFVIILQGAERKVPVQHFQKMQGRRMVGSQSSNISLKVNTADVIPVIFASSIVSFPVVIAQFFQVDYTAFGGKILLIPSSSSWLEPEQPIYSIGMVIYLILTIVFAYLYTSTTFNPPRVANSMKKQDDFIPGIHPGKSTFDCLNSILNYIVFVSAYGLIIVSIVPIIVSGLFTISHLSFAGTSLAIIIGVILETVKIIESQMLVRNYKEFLNN